MLIKKLGRKFGTEEIEAITKDKENYVSLSIDVVVGNYENLGEIKEKKIKLRFIDSFRFMVGSLDSLVNDLVRGCEDKNLISLT